MPSHITEERIVCPFCNCFHCDSQRFDVAIKNGDPDNLAPTDDFEMKCGNCNQMFYVERRIRIIFETRKTKRPTKAKGVCFQTSTDR
jgi:hypothetical protein